MSIHRKCSRTGSPSWISPIELRATNQVTSVGRLSKDYSQYLVLATSQFSNLDDVRKAVVAIDNGAPIRVGDLADVRYGVADRQTLITGNGQPAALINISRQIGGNILQLAQQIKDEVRNLGSAIPKTLHISVVYDLAEFVSESIGSVRDAIVVGAVLAVGILFLFLRDGRTTLVAATSLPLSVIGTFFFLKMFGGTLNLMSLGGLAIAIGLIIDDAVVDHRKHLSPSRPRRAGGYRSRARHAGTARLRS